MREGELHFTEGDLDRVIREVTSQTDPKDEESARRPGRRAVWQRVR